MLNRLGRHRTQRQDETIGLNVVGSERLIALAQVFDINAGVCEVSLGTVKYSQKLDGAGVAILEPAVGQSIIRYLPTASDEVQGIGRSPVDLLEPVKGKRSFSWRGGRNFLDPEVTWKLF